METEAQLIELLIETTKNRNVAISVKELTALFIDRFADDYERKITPKWVGGIVRRKLGLKTYKTNGIFVIPEKEFTKLDYLSKKYGVEPPAQR